MYNKLKILKKFNGYIIYDTDYLDTEGIETGAWGYIEHVDADNKIYTIKGSLSFPEYIREELAKIMEERGWKYYFNNGSYRKAKKR